MKVKSTRFYTTGKRERVEDIEDTIYDSLTGDRIETNIANLAMAVGILFERSAAGQTITREDILRVVNKGDDEAYYEVIDD